MAKSSKKEFPVLENNNNYHFQHDNSWHMKVLLHGTTATGLFSVLQHVMGKWFRTIHSQQVLVTLFTFAHSSWVAKIGYSYLAMISQLVAQVDSWLWLKMAKSLSHSNTSHAIRDFGIFTFKILLISPTKTNIYICIPKVGVVFTQIMPGEHTNFKANWPCIEWDSQNLTFC